MIILKEILHRKFNFFMGLVGMSTIVALVIAFFSITQATKKETIRLTRDMGFNVRIIPEESDMSQFWIEGYSDLTMSEEVVDKIMEKESINYAHLTATLHKKVEWREMEVIFTGISRDEKEPLGRKKSKMIFAIEKDKVYLGYELAQQFKIKEGDLIDIFDKKFEVSKTLTESGSDDDIRVYFDLETLQRLLKMEGRVNEVMAINCMCSTENGDPLGELRAELEKIAPEAKVIMKSAVADARENQRKMTDKYFAIFFPIILIICGLWLGSVTMTNVKERMHEIGIMHALGFSGWRISKLFFLRAFVIGLSGALVGFVIGVLISYQLGPKIVKITAIDISTNYYLLFWAILIGPLFAALASLLPILWAINKDSAYLLKEH